MYQCQRKCRVYIHNEWNVGLYNKREFRVKELQLTIADVTLTYRICVDTDVDTDETYSRILNITCLSWTQGKIFSLPNHQYTCKMCVRAFMYILHAFESYNSACTHHVLKSLFLIVNFYCSRRRLCNSFCLEVSEKL